LREEVEKADNTLDKLRNLIRKHLEEFQGDMNMAVVYLTETHKSYRLVEEQIKAMSKMYLDIVAQIVEQGQEEGIIRKDLYMGLVKRFIVGSVNEVINTWIHSGGKYDLVSMSEPLVELFLKGIGTQACKNQQI